MKTINQLTVCTILGLTFVLQGCSTESQVKSTAQDMSETTSFSQGKGKTAQKPLTMNVQKKKKRQAGNLQEQASFAWKENGKIKQMWLNPFYKVQFNTAGDASSLKAIGAKLVNNGQVKLWDVRAIQPKALLGVAETLSPTYSLTGNVNSVVAFENEIIIKMAAKAGANERTALFAEFGLQEVSSLEAIGYYVVAVPEGIDVLKTITELSARSSIESVSPNFWEPRTIK